MLISLKYVLFPPTTLNANHVIYERSVVWKFLQLLYFSLLLVQELKGYKQGFVSAFYFYTDIHLIYQIQQLLLRGVHAHGPHGVSQLGGVDGPAPVHVELVEGLGWKTYLDAQLYDLLYDLCDDYWLFVMIIGYLWWLSLFRIQIWEKYNHIYVLG